ncbi:tandem-95 repeat protein [Haloarcula sp. S1CR25-12]|uniref:Tandem-95 repeat protein n=1 Tax=Haloarcula saliterrae TaxID=2950534 RepID=A0ABU2FDC3_9EURY|nr:tandem-95 repeat protein [Haloarcula sp. S1CR25-12]MDS0260263.1 tandem-95 repeat protein [Haloarcula sp. S1CR25-12]
MNGAMANRRMLLLIGVVVCVALSGVTVVPASGSATVGTSESVVSGGTMQVTTQETFSFDSKYPNSDPCVVSQELLTRTSSGGTTCTGSLEADGSSTTLEFENWQWDTLEQPDIGLNLRETLPDGTISDPNGDSFQFSSFTTEVFCGTPISFTVAGYEDGTQVDSQSYTISSTEPVTTRVIGFASVDEVRFEGYSDTSSFDANSCVTVDDFVVDQAVSSNTQPSFSNLDATVTYDEASGTPVVVDSDATVADTELDAAGDYAGSTLTVVREGGASADDSYGFDTSAGTFATSGSELTTGGSAFASYTQSGGTLTIDFTAAETAATPALVDDVLQAITYENIGDPVVVEYGLTLSFDDGDPDGALQTSESQSVIFDPALEPISTSTTLDFTSLGPELGNGDSVDARNVRELLFYGYQFGDAAENSLVASNELQLEQATRDPATTGTRFESDEPFALDSLDIDNYGDSGQDVTVYGYRDGTRVASQTYTMAASSGYQTRDPDGDDSEFRRVDEVRFTTGVSDQVAIDNIVVDQSNVSPSADLDTGADGTASSVTFSENDDQGTASGDGVAVTGPVDLADSDGTVESVTVTLDNPQGDAGEGLAVDTSGLAADLGFSASTNEITVTRNTASTADLEAAVEAVRFQNDDDAPDATDRAVTVTATDDAGATASATATVTVQPGNDAPSITAPGGTLQPDEDVAFDLTGANEIQVADPDDGGGLMRLTLTAQHGTLTVGSTTGLAVVSGSNGASSLTVSGPKSDVNAALGTLSYRSDTDYFGTDTVTATVSDEGNTGTDPGLTGDGNSETDSATVSLDVQPVADAPTIGAIADQATDEDQPLSGVAFTVGDAETAAGSLTLSFSADTPSLVESHAFGGSGTDRTLDIVPAADQSGSTLVTVEVSDGSLTAREEFRLTVDPVDDRPTITAVSDLTVDEDSDVAPVSFQVDDVETAPGSLTVGASSGDQSLVPDANLAVSGTGTDRTLDVTLAPNATGTATITLEADDGGLSGTESFTLTVAPVNDPPSIDNAPDATVTEDSPYSYTPAVTDVDAGDTTAFSIVNQPSWATFDTATGELSGTPTNDDVGSYDGIGITVEDGDGATDTVGPFGIDVANTNDPPTIGGTAPDAPEDSVYSFTPTAVDVDAGDAVTFTITNRPPWATFDTATGEIAGTPTNDDVGAYGGIEITATDTAGETATLGPFGIDVTNTNDPPSIDNTPSATVAEDSVYSYTPAVSDADAGDTTTFTIVNQPSWATFDTATGELSGTPTNDDVGTADGIEITVEDGGGATDTVGPFGIDVTNTNDAPTADADSYTTAEDTALSVAAPGVLDGDGDVDGDALTVALVSSPANGALTLAANGSVEYVPAANRTGEETFTYEIADGNGATAQATVTLTVEAVNDAPSIDLGANRTVTNDTSERTVPDFATGFSPGGGSDEAGQGVRAFVVSVERDPAGILDSVAVTDTDGDDNGTLTYAVDDGVEGTATVAVRVRDDGGTANEGTDTSGVERFNITVDTRPPAVTGARTGQRTLTLRTDETLSTDSGDVPDGGDFAVTAGGRAVAVTDVAVDGRNLSLTLADSIAAEDDVTLRYAPGRKVPEDAGGNRVAGVTDLSVTNTVPDAVDDAYTVLEDNTLAVDADLGVVANDTDADDGDLTVSVVTNTSDGRLTLAANGSFEYRPDRNYNGDDAFVYELRDTDGNTDRAVVNITVLPVRDGGGGGGSSSGTSVTVDESDDSATAEVSVSDAKRGEPVQIPLAGGDSDTGGDQRNVDVPSIELTVERDGDFGLSVSTSEIRAGGPAAEEPESGVSAPSDRDREFAASTGSTPMGRVTVTHSIDDADIGEVAFTFRLRKSYLRENRIGPSSVSLYRDETTRWNRLPTTVVGETDTHYVFRATAPGLSVFTVGTNASMVTVTEATRRTATVDTGQPAAVDVTLTNRGTVERTYPLELTADGSAVATDSVDVAAGTNRTVTLSSTFETAGTYALAVDGQSVGTVSVRARSATGPTPEPATVTPTETATGASGPGMGVVAALLAVSLAVGLRRRRER